MSCRVMNLSGLSGYVQANCIFPKVKYSHEMSVMYGHRMEVVWTYEDYEIRENLTNAELIFDYQQLLILAELI